MMIRIIIASSLLLLFSACVAQNQMLLIGTDDEKWLNHPNLLFWIDSNRDVYTDVAGTTPAGSGDRIGSWREQVSGGLFTCSSNCAQYFITGVKGNKLVFQEPTYSRMFWANGYVSLPDSSATIVGVFNWKGSANTSEYLMDGFPVRGTVLTETSSISDYIPLTGFRTPTTTGYQIWVDQLKGKTETSYQYLNGSLIDSGVGEIYRSGIGDDGTAGSPKGIALFGFYNPGISFAQWRGDLYLYAIFSPGLSDAEFVEFKDWVDTKY